MLATAFANPVPAPCSPAPGRIKLKSGATDILTSQLSGGSLRTLEAKEHAFCEGDPATHVYQVEVGNICLYKTMSDGRRQVVDFAYPGDIVGLGALGAHAANAQAMVRTRLRCIPMTTLQDVGSRDTRLGLELYAAVSRELMAARELLFTVSQCSAAERLASFLLALSRRNERRGEDAGTIVLPMSRTDIADFLGLTIETVSRTFSRFRAEGLIELEQCILVVILDAAGLAGLTGGS